MAANCRLLAAMAAKACWLAAMAPQPPLNYGDGDYGDGDEEENQSLYAY